MTVVRFARRRKQDAGLGLGSGCKIGTFFVALPSPSDHHCMFRRGMRREVGASCPSGGQGQSFPLRFPREGPPVLAQTSPWSSGRVPVSVPSLAPQVGGRDSAEAAKPTCALCDLKAVVVFFPAGWQCGREYDVYMYVYRTGNHGVMVPW